jgi:hypothetical protein
LAVLGPRAPQSAKATGDRTARRPDPRYGSISPFGSVATLLGRR